MLRSLLVLVLLAGVAHADKRVYDVRATRKVERTGSIPSCGAVPRMLKDKHILTIDDDGLVRVNGLKWRAMDEEPNLLIDFHAGKGQKTFLMMDLYVNMRGLSGRYILAGVIPDPENPRDQYVCVDAVELDGTAR